jgi:hypothetical protein
MKRKVFLFLSVLSVVLWCSACEESEDDSEKGKTAAAEFCNCLDEGYTMSKCNEKFHDKYGKNFSTEFINAFNKEGDKCDIKANKE